MFKDYEKYLSTSLKVYLFVLIIIFILKLVGLNYFGLDINNPIIIDANNFLERTKLIYLLNIVTLYIMFYIYISIVTDNKKVKIISLVCTIIEVIIQFVLMKYDKNGQLRSFLDIAIMFIVPIIINKKFTIKKSIIMIIMIMIYQLISYVIRNQEFASNYNCSMIDFLLNIDQLLLLIITYKVYFMKGDENKCQVAGFSSLKKLNLKKSLKKLQKSWHNFKKQDRVTKLTNIIYFILSFMWNILTFVIILLVAKINDTFIECIFIITSFWLSKGAFGKPFHLKSMVQCFIVSNLSYYILNRLTTPLGISIIVPILLGVGLSYITSKFVKKAYKPLYRGMPEELFEDTILKVVDKDSEKYKICYDFYINKKSIVSLAMKYNYTEAGIRKIKDRVNDKIKRLN